MSVKDPNLAARGAAYRARYENGLPVFVRRVLCAVEVETGVTIAQFRRGGRLSARAGLARTLAVQSLRLNTKLGCQAIAAVMNIRHHQSICRMLRCTRRG